MSRALTAGELKALVRQLVAAVGGVEAAAVELSCSFQRVSQWQNPNHPDQMSFLQISALEKVAERDIVTGVASKAIVSAANDAIGKAAVETVTAAAAALQRVHDMDADGVRDLAEIRDVQVMARAALSEAEDLVDASLRLVPTSLSRPRPLQPRNAQEGP